MSTKRPQGFAPQTGMKWQCLFCIRQLHLIMTGYHAKLRQLFFESPFTSRTKLGSPPNFAKTRFGRSPTFHFSTKTFLFETSNGRLPPKHGSDRRETLPKRVSGDPRHFIFRHPQTFLATKIFVGKIFRQHPENFFSKVPVLEELCRFRRQWRMQLENSLPDI